jgi:Domain of unknown function (DUF4276)
MARLLIHVEGETEETFVNEILRPHFLGRGFESVAARQLGNERLRSQRGGIRGWNTARTDIIRHLRQDPGCIMTTMVDYYGLPQAGEKAWPGRPDSTSLPVPDRAVRLEAAILENLSVDIDCRQFVPFVLVHEFEGLLFSDCRAFADSISRPDMAASFQEIRDAFDTPEHIDDSPVTAPSKRVERLVPTYQKPLFGNLAALEIGLRKIRAECPHFAAWLTRLETIAGS